MNYMYGYLHTSAKGGGSAKQGYFNMTKPVLPEGYGEEGLESTLFADEIARLEAKENAFCAKFGASDPQQLISSMYDFFHSKDRSRDLEVLQRFSSANLRKYLEIFRQANDSQLEGQKVKIHFISDRPLKLRKIFKGMKKIKIDGEFMDIIGSLEAGEHTITLDWDTLVIKGLINRLGKRQLKRENSNLENVMDALSGELKNLIQVHTSNTGKSIQDFVYENRSSIFQYKPSEIKNFKQNNPKLYAKLRRQVLNFFDNVICKGASSELKRAIDMVWDRNDISIFMGGATADKWMNLTVGGFGELQAAILFQYYANCTGNLKIARAITEITGNDFNTYGQKMRSDLTIFERFGIQIKNFSSDKGYNQKTNKSYTRTTEVNLHPSQLPSIGSEEFVAYIANSYFNSDVEQYTDEEINNFIKGHTTELLNLDLKSSFDDKVTFYLIGQHLIPGSEILKSYASQDIRVHTKISHPSPIGGDSDFNTSKRHAPFTKYWESIYYPPVEGEFTPKSSAEISNIDSRVSFHTTFTYSAFFNAAFKNRSSGFTNYRLI